MEHNERIDSSAGEPVLACKRRKHLRLAALAVCCALLGGIAGGAATGLLLQGCERAAMRPAGQQTAVSGGESTGAEPSAARVASTAGELTPTQLYERYAPCVVGVLNLSAVTDLYGKDTMQASTGSGVLLTGDGEILTNYHVVKDCTQLTVTLYDGTEHTAKLLGYEEDSDIALLKIDGSGYRHARLGDSDRLRIGTEVAAIGNPLGDLDYSLNVGYISAKDRDVDLDGPSIRMMQLDAAINPGNSGGPLFDLRGNVVGVTTAKYSGETVTGATIEGIGFAIPINDVREILSELREYGRVPNRAQLGVMVGTVYSTNTARNGRVQVRDVTEDSAGAHAGLRDGDFILALDDYTVRTLSDLSAALRHYRGGQHATLTIERYGKTFRLPIVFDSKDDAVQDKSQQHRPMRWSRPSRTVPGPDPMSSIDRIPSLFHAFFSFFSLFSFFSTKCTVRLAGRYIPVFAKRAGEKSCPAGGFGGKKSVKGKTVRSPFAFNNPPQRQNCKIILQNFILQF